MGMSASQARLIALTARMSDTEYEAQQINQQRLTLSNKMNEVYQAAMDMEVPTAPSKIDYMHKEYKGTTGSGETIKVSTDKNGSFQIQRKAKGESADYAGNLSNKTTATKYFTPAPIEDVKPNGITKQHTYKYTPNATKAEDIEANKVYRREVIAQLLTGNNPHTIDDLDEEINAEHSNIPDELLEDNAEITIDGNTYIWNGGNLYAKNADKDDTDSYLYFDNDDKLTVDYSDELAYTDDQIKAMVGKYYVNDGSGNARLLKAEDFDSEGHCRFTEDCLFTESPDGTTTGTPLTVEYGSDTFGGYTTMDLTTAKKQYADNDAFQDLLLGISHTFPGQEGDFTILVDSQGNFRACFTTDLGNGDSTVRTYQFNPMGEYWEGVEGADPDSITFDTNGNVNGVSVGNQKINLEVEMVTDEDKYEIAMDKYKSDKVEYDAEQNRLNKQTSIYQRQDKQLELKLTRLDNERNALNTEIEAVKKVIQDSIDKGFKTFSG